MKKKILLTAMMFILCSYNVISTYYIVPKDVKDSIKDYKVHGIKVDGIRLKSNKLRVFESDSLFTLKKDYNNEYHVVAVD